MIVIKKNRNGDTRTAEKDIAIDKMLILMISL